MNLADVAGMYDPLGAAPEVTSPPDGIYPARLDRAEVKATKDDIPMLSLDTIIINGDYEGRHLFVNLIFDPNKTDEQKQFLNRDLLRLGFVGSIANLEAALPSFLDRIYKIKVKTTRNRRTNEPQTFNSLLEEIVDGHGVAQRDSNGLPAANFAPAGRGGKPKGSPPPELPPEDDIDF